MANEENLTPFKPGQSGNPNGRPKGKSITKILTDLLSKKASTELKGLVYVQKLTDGLEAAELEALTLGDIVTLRLVSEAIANGDMSAIKEILDRTEGKAKQSIDLTTLGKEITAISQIEVIHTNPNEAASK